MSASEKKPIDWEAVEREYRAGVKTLRQIGDEHGCSHTAIRKRADAEGWVRDLSDRIKAKAAEIVSKDEVSKSVSKEEKVSERQIVDSNAEMMANVIRSHHKSLGRLDTVIKLLFDRLEAELSGTELFDKLGELMLAPDEKGQDKLNELYRKVIALPSHTDTAKKLAETLKTKIELERKVFKIEDQPPSQPLSPDQVDARLAQLLGKSGG